MCIGIVMRVVLVLCVFSCSVFAIQGPVPKESGTALDWYALTEQEKAYVERTKEDIAFLFFKKITDLCQEVSHVIDAQSQELVRSVSSERESVQACYEKFIDALQKAQGALFYQGLRAEYIVRAKHIYTEFTNRLVCLAQEQKKVESLFDRCYVRAHETNAHQLPSRLHALLASCRNQREKNMRYYIPRAATARMKFSK